MNKWFLMEYGINVNNGFNASYGYNYNYSGILIGPNVFMGYETLFNNKFEFTVGFNFDACYYFILDKNFESNLYNDILGYYDIQAWLFNFGIEFRWKFAILYKFKNKTMPTSYNSR